MVASIDSLSLGELSHRDARSPPPRPQNDIADVRGQRVESAGLGQIASGPVSFHILTKDAPSDANCFH